MQERKKDIIKMVQTHSRKKKGAKKKYMEIDFSAAKEANVILRGTVKYCRRVDGKEPNCIIVDCNGHPVLIEKEDCVNFPFAKTLISLIGEEISFMVKDYQPDTDICIGSMTMAYEEKEKPILENLESGSVMDGIIIYETVHGAYISVDGIYGFMRNRDFSNDGTAVRDIYAKHDKIRVKLLMIRNDGELLFEPEKKHIGEKSIIEFAQINIGDIYKGRVTGSYIDRIYVNIAPECDVICNVPRYIDLIRTGEFVLVKIRSKRIDENGKRKLKGYIIDRVENETR